jgi:hypothetical protein
MRSHIFAALGNAIVIGVDHNKSRDLLLVPGRVSGVSDRRGWKGAVVGRAGPLAAVDDGAALDGRTGANSDVSCAIFASANLSYTERMTFGKLALRENLKKPPIGGDLSVLPPGIGGFRIPTVNGRSEAVTC